MGIAGGAMGGPAAFHTERLVTGETRAQKEKINGKGKTPLPLFIC